LKVGPDNAEGYDAGTISHMSEVDLTDGQDHIVGIGKKAYNGNNIYYLIADGVAEFIQMTQQS
jgi:hypothetical protein